MGYMHLLDLDLDFFLNENAYGSGHDGERQSSEYKPWTAGSVRQFLEDRCRLSSAAPVPGRTVKSHDEAISFWGMLIEAGRLRIPFEVIHVDDHPDMWLGDGIHLKSGLLYIELESLLTILKEKPLNPGNYLTFALAYGWISCLKWVPPLSYFNNPPEWDADARSEMIRGIKTEGEPDSTGEEQPSDGKHVITFTILPWNKLKIDYKFDYITLSRSPDFTPPESDVLIDVIESYMQQI